MKICIICNEHEMDFYDFCAKDGTKLLSLNCPACGTSQITIFQKFCGRCGQQLSPEALLAAAREKTNG